MFYFLATHDFATKYYYKLKNASNLKEAIEKTKEIIKLNVGRGHLTFQEATLLEVKDEINFDPVTGEVLPSECLIVERNRNENS